MRQKIKDLYACVLRPGAHNVLLCFKLHAYKFSRGFIKRSDAA